jgi:hypothetical protein
VLAWRSRAARRAWTERSFAGAARVEPGAKLRQRRKKEGRGARVTAGGDAIIFKEEERQQGPSMGKGVADVARNELPLHDLGESVERRKKTPLWILTASGRLGLGWPLGWKKCRWAGGEERG